MFSMFVTCSATSGLKQHLFKIVRLNTESLQAPGATYIQQVKRNMRVVVVRGINETKPMKHQRQEHPNMCLPIWEKHYFVFSISIHIIYVQVIHLAVKETFVTCKDITFTSDTTFHTKI